MFYKSFLVSSIALALSHVSAVSPQEKEECTSYLMQHSEELYKTVFKEFEIYVGSDTKDLNGLVSYKTEDDPMDMDAQETVKEQANIILKKLVEEQPDYLLKAKKEGKTPEEILQPHLLAKISLDLALQVLSSRLNLTALGYNQNGLYEISLDEKKLSVANRLIEPDSPIMLSLNCNYKSLVDFSLFPSFPSNMGSIHYLALNRVMFSDLPKKLKRLDLECPENASFYKETTVFPEIDLKLLSHLSYLETFTLKKYPVLGVIDHLSKRLVYLNLKQCSPHTYQSATAYFGITTQIKTEMFTGKDVYIPCQALFPLKTDKEKQHEKRRVISYKETQPQDLRSFPQKEGLHASFYLGSYLKQQGLKNQFQEWVKERFVVLSHVEGSQVNMLMPFNSDQFSFVDVDIDRIIHSMPASFYKKPYNLEEIFSHLLPSYGIKVLMEYIDAVTFDEDNNIQDLTITDQDFQSPQSPFRPNFNRYLKVSYKSDIDNSGKEKTIEKFFQYQFPANGTQKFIFPSLCLDLSSVTFNIMVSIDGMGIVKFVSNEPCTFNFCNKIFFLEKGYKAELNNVRISAPVPQGIENMSGMTQMTVDFKNSTEGMEYLYDLHSDCKDLRLLNVPKDMDLKRLPKTLKSIFLKGARMRQILTMNLPAGTGLAYCDVVKDDYEDDNSLPDYGYDDVSFIVTEKQPQLGEETSSSIDFKENFYNAHLYALQEVRQESDIKEQELQRKLQETERKLQETESLNKELAIKLGEWYESQGIKRPLSEISGAVPEGNAPKRQRPSYD